MKNNKERISYSAVNDFKKCPKKMYLKKKYTNKEKGSALAFGAAIESAVEALLKGESLEKAYSIFKSEWKVRPKNKYEGAKKVFDSPDTFYYNSDFDKNLITDASNAVFDVWAKETIGRVENSYEDFVKKIQEKVKLDQPLAQKEKKLYNRIMWYCCRKKGPHLIKAFRDELLPLVEEVVECQKRVELESEEGHILVGYIDFILKIKGIKSPMIIDLKTSGKEYESHDLDASDQLRIYAAAEEIKNIGYMVTSKKLKHDKKCDNCGHIRENSRLTLCEKCKEKKEKGRYTITQTSATTQFIYKTLKKRELRETLEDYSEVLNAIVNKVCWKNPNNCFDFNNKCEFYDHCWNNKKLSEIEHLKLK